MEDSKAKKAKVHPISTPIKCIYYLGTIAEMLAIPVQVHFQGRINNSVGMYMFLVGAALALLSGTVLAKIAQNWFYLKANIILTVWIILPRF